MLMRGSSGHCGVNDLIYDAEGENECQYWCKWGQLCVDVRVVMGSHEQAEMGLTSWAESAYVTKHTS